MGLPPDKEFLSGQLQLEGKAVVVTGGRQGIGEAIAVAAAQAGADVLVTTREEGAAAETVSRIADLGARALGVTADVRSRADCERVVRSAVDEFGRLDVLVNNAGVSAAGAALEYGEDDWDRVFDTNLKGSFLMSQAAARTMSAQSGGRIINLSSTYARRPYARMAAYASAKAGLEQLTRVLALEWAPLGVTVNALALTSVLTETRAHLYADPDRLARRLAEIPLGRLAEVSDAVGAFLYLAGPAAAFVTGHTLLVDGGFTLT